MFTLKNEMLKKLVDRPKIIRNNLDNNESLKLLKCGDLPLLSGLSPSKLDRFGFLTAGEENCAFPVE